MTANVMPDLREVILAEELRRLALARRSGVMEVVTADWAKAVFLMSGRVVFASSTLERDKLGEHLIRLGRISREDFARAFERSQLDNERLGQTLVGAGLLAEEELGRVLALQVQKIVLSLFTLTAGELRFHEGTDPIPRDLAVDLSTPRLLFEGARLFPDAERIERALGDPERMVRVREQPPFDLGRVSLSPPEKEVLAAARAGARLSVLLAGAGSRPLLARAVFAFLCADILADAAEGARPAPGPASETESFQMAVAATPTRPGNVTPPGTPVGLRERILRLYEALPRATHYEVLEVAPDSGGQAIDAAYRQLTAEQDREWRDLMGDVQLSSLLSTLRLRRREAYLVLSDANRRGAYDKRLGHSLPAPKTPQITAEKHTRAKRLAREAQTLLSRGDRDRAIPLLLEAVDLDPEERDARRQLAIALAHHPTLQKTAERHFLAALEQAPGDTDLRFRLARYYCRLGLNARAVVHLRAVLKADPDHEGAARELSALEAAAGPRR